MLSSVKGPQSPWFKSGTKRISSLKGPSKAHCFHWLQWAVWSPRNVMLWFRPQSPVQPRSKGRVNLTWKCRGCIWRKPAFPKTLGLLPEDEWEVNGKNCRGPLCPFKSFSKFVFCYFFNILVFTQCALLKIPSYDSFSVSFFLEVFYVLSRKPATDMNAERTPKTLTSLKVHQLKFMPWKFTNQHRACSFWLCS